MDPRNLIKDYPTVVLAVIIVLVLAVVVMYMRDMYQKDELHMRDMEVRDDEARQEMKKYVCKECDKLCGGDRVMTGRNQNTIRSDQREPLSSNRSSGWDAE